MNLITKKIFSKKFEHNTSMANKLYKFFHKIKNKNYFEGCYFKQNSKKFFISFIPSISVDKNWKKECFIQVITQNLSHCFKFNFQAKLYPLKVLCKKGIFAVEKNKENSFESFTLNPCVFWWKVRTKIFFKTPSKRKSFMLKISCLHSIRGTNLKIPIIEFLKKFPRIYWNY